MQIGHAEGGTAERDVEPRPRGHADPDSRARTHLANERTFLAWLRTGLGLIVLGLAAVQFIGVDRNLITGIRAVSDFAAILGAAQFAHHRRDEYHILDEIGLDVGDHRGGGSAAARPPMRSRLVRPGADWTGISRDW